MKINFNQLEQIKKEEQVLEMYVESIDDSFNMIGYVSDKIKTILPRDEASSVVNEDGLVDTKHIINKAGKRIEVCIKDIIKDQNGTTLVIASKKILELKVRRWMYMYLKPNMKLKGVVRGLTEYAAFIDVGGGVTGMLKTSDISDVIVNHASDILKLGQRIEVNVKKFDRDTGKIDLSYKENFGTFEDNIKNIKDGDIVEGTVRTRTRTGIFIELKPNLSGIADHVSGIEYGQKVLVSIKKINIEKKKIKLVIIG
ncbi:MAG: S1 RNA-binding domain-containing protein [Clostridia bacterium]|nr:S1 RNA-binding domain-containing protein [Clostridia bacterium]MDD4386357.1 S1 RNA-binding domain-containing protein [Clostridia bacterium]